MTTSGTIFTMSNLRFVTVEGEPNPDDKKVLVEGLLSHHASKGHPRKSELFSIFLKDENNKVHERGCTIAYTDTFICLLL